MKIQGLFDYNQPLVAAATLLSVAVIAATSLGAYVAYKARVAGNLIQVTGSAKESVVADFARWTISVEAKTPVGNQQSGFDSVERAANTIVNYLKKQGLEDVETPSPQARPNYAYRQNSEPLLTGHTVTREIVVRSDKVEVLTELASNISPFMGSGYEVTTGAVELTYQKLPEMRVKLLSEAIKDARARAEAIAKETGRSVGAIRSATSGVVQVLPQGGVDISDYGSYDTQSKNKDVMVTVRASFTIN